MQSSATQLNAAEAQVQLTAFQGWGSRLPKLSPFLPVTKANEYSFIRHSVAPQVLSERARLETPAGPAVCYRGVRKGSGLREQVWQRH